MIIEIKINIQQSKYGTDLGSANLTLDTDEIDYEAIRNIGSSLVNSALLRAENKLNGLTKPSEEPPLPPPVELVSVKEL